MPDFADDFRLSTYGALRLDPDAPMRIDLLGHYRARVVARADDGSTVDVEPDDARLKGNIPQGIKLIVGVPGVVVVVEVGSVVWVGWEGGDPSRPRALPAWESATVTKLIINGSEIHIGGAGGDPVATKSDIAAIKTAIQAGVPVPNDGGAGLQTTILAAWPVSVGSSKVSVVR